MSSRPDARFDDLVHSPVRLRLCGLLRSVQQLEFRVVRDTLELSDAHLSKNLKVLADAGYLALRKERSVEHGDRRLRTWLSLTPLGRHVLEAHLAALAQIAGEGSVGP
ncbi:transcriptional regulator [Brachybacterium sp. AOP43-C2-M15]|uniref:transcriptional regulator n=1 Tax=Brachybacterium sp. AOP43-C2-M15 TaxID=3457661 RepID=UPI0040344B99